MDTNIEGNVSKIRKIGELVMQGYSDEDISNKVDTAAYKVKQIKLLLGLGKRGRKNSVLDGATSKLSDGKNCKKVSFTISQKHYDVLGIYEKYDYGFSAKIGSKGKIELQIVQIEDKKVIK